MMLANILIAQPTESGNGFIKGNAYRFIHSRNSCYYTQIGNMIRYVTLPQNGCSSPSAHLWDGKNWDLAGHFIAQEGA